MALLDHCGITSTYTVLGPKYNVCYLTLSDHYGNYSLTLDTLYLARQMNKCIDRIKYTKTQK